MTPFIVGLGHVARVGKDVSAEALCRDLGFVRVGFADQLKWLALVADPLVTPVVRTVNIGIGKGKLAHVVAGLGWEAAKDAYPEVRMFLENLGKGAREVFGDSFWVDQLFARYAHSTANRIVIADVRYQNEVDAIKARGGHVFKVTRPGRQPEGSRPSELQLQDWDGWDHTFANDGTVEELQSQVVAHVKGLLARQEVSA